MRRSRTPLILLAIAAFVLLVATLPAQLGPGGWAERPMHSGFPVSGVGDVNGDGFDDLAIPLPVGNPGGYRVVSGADLSTIYRIEDRTPHQNLRGIQRIGDLNQDGTSDFVLFGGISHPLYQSDSHFVVHSGRTGGLLFQDPGLGYPAVFGKLFAFSLGDQTGDGIPEYLVQWRRSWILGWSEPAEVRSGATHQVLGTLMSEIQVSASFEIGDLDGNSFDESVMLVFGLGAGDYGALVAYSPSTDQRLWEWRGSWTRRLLGAAVPLPDRTGDGIPEVRVAVGLGPPTVWERSSFVDLDGASGAILSDRPVRDYHRNLAAAGDVDGDGTPEYLHIEYDEHGDQRLVLTDVDAAEVASFAAGSTSYSSEFRAHSVGDTDGDGRAEVAYATDVWGEHRVVGWSRLFLRVQAAPTPQSGSQEALLIGATPFGVVSFAVTQRRRAMTFPGGPCSGVVIPFGRPFAIVHRHADGQGVLLRWIDIPPAALSRAYLMGLDHSSCRYSNLIAL